MSPHVRNVCKIGQKAACCRYLVGDATGMHCAKLAPAVKYHIDERVAFGVTIARGDNCPGRPLDEVL